MGCSALSKLEVETLATETTIAVASTRRSEAQPSRAAVVRTETPISGPINKKKQKHKQQNKHCPEQEQEEHENHGEISLLLSDQRPSKEEEQQQEYREAQEVEEDEISASIFETEAIEIGIEAIGKGNDRDAVDDEDEITPIAEQPQHAAAEEETFVEHDMGGDGDDDMEEEGEANGESKAEKHDYPVKVEEEESDDTVGENENSFSETSASISENHVCQEEVIPPPPPFSPPSSPQLLEQQHERTNETSPEVSSTNEILHNEVNETFPNEVADDVLVVDDLPPRHSHQSPNTHRKISAEDGRSRAQARVRLRELQYKALTSAASRQKNRRRKKLEDDHPMVRNCTIEFIMTELSMDAETIRNYLLADDATLSPSSSSPRRKTIPKGPNFLLDQKYGDKGASTASPNCRSPSSNNSNRKRGLTSPRAPKFQLDAKDRDTRQPPHSMVDSLSFAERSHAFAGSLRTHQESSWYQGRTTVPQAPKFHNRQTAKHKRHSHPSSMVTEAV